MRSGDEKGKLRGHPVIGHPGSKWLMISQIFPTIYTGSFKLEKEGTKKNPKKRLKLE